MAVQQQCVLVVHGYAIRFERCDLSDTGQGVLLGKRVLVVDDNAINRLVAIGSLEPAGLIVEVAEDGETALKMLSESQFDAVLMDLGMPGMPGDQVAAEVNRRQPDAKVVVITGWGAETKEILERVPNVEMVVQKPFSVSDLVEKLERVLADNRKMSRK